jgi:hypothetical protein
MGAKEKSAKIIFCNHWLGLRELSTIMFETAVPKILLKMCQMFESAVPKILLKMCQMFGNKPSAFQT